MENNSASIDQEHGRRFVSKMAAGDGHGENSSYFDGWKAYDIDPYHPVRNPEGIIQMGLAENQLCHDLIENWIKRHSEVSICTAEGASQFKEVAIFQDYHGLPSFRKAIARFMEKVRGEKVRFDPERIVMSGGATGAVETIAFCLADPGDAFLVPTPYYPGFNRDFCWRTRAQLFPVHCKSSNLYRITKEALDSAYREATRHSIRVKGLIIINPSNPLGITMDTQTLSTVLNFASEKKIHVVCDEVYAGTVFHNPQFTSIAQVVQHSNIDPSLVHIVCSLSKDLGLPGFRVGIIYSYNDVVVSCARRMSSFGLVSSQTQHLIASMLSDEDFTTGLLEESRKRLSRRREVFELGLRQVGIRCLPSNAGLFSWMDLRHLLREDTVEGEKDLWRVIITEVKLNVSPGTSFHCIEPGWFRACFANMDDETMKEALRRIQSFVEKMKEAEMISRKQKWQNGLLRLSLPRRFDQEMIGTTTVPSSCLMSPRSPLVHATNLIAVCADSFIDS